MTFSASSQVSGSSFPSSEKGRRFRPSIPGSDVGEDRSRWPETDTHFLSQYFAETPIR